MKANKKMILVLMWAVVTIATFTNQLDWESWARITGIAMIALVFIGFKLNLSVRHSVKKNLESKTKTEKIEEKKSEIQL